MSLNEVTNKAKQAILRIADTADYSPAVGISTLLDLKEFINLQIARLDTIAKEAERADATEQETEEDSSSSQEAPSDAEDEVILKRVAANFVHSLRGDGSGQ